MTYTIVLSGPAQARTKVERALSELPGIDVLQTTHHYGLEHAKGEKFLTLEGDCDSSLPEALRAMNRANVAAEPFGWRLRMHGEKPEPAPTSSLVTHILDRLTRLEVDHGLLSPATMTLESPPAFEQGASGGYAAEQSRRAWYFPIDTTGGVKAAGDLLTTAPVSGMSVNNAVGELIIPGTETTAQGVYYARCSATQNTSVSTSNPSNPRIDTVCATVSDSGYTEPSGGSGNQWSIQLVAGTPTAGATLSNLNGVAALPASSLLLAYVLVPASATNIITADIGDVRPFAYSYLHTFNRRAATTTVSANSGDHIVASSGTFTATLPAPFPNARVRVTNYGTGVVTVSQHASEVIYGLGCTTSGVASIPLGATGATATLESDGTNWFITSGMQDTGRVTPSFTNSWAGVQYRLQGNVLRLYGVFVSGTSATAAFTLPSGRRPTAATSFATLNPVGTGATGEIDITTGGVVTPTGNVGFGIWAEGCTFTVD